MLRDRFPIVARLAYLNSCSQGALSVDVREAHEEYLRDWDELGSPWELWVAKVDEARASYNDSGDVDAALEALAANRGLL